MTARELIRQLLKIRDLDRDIQIDAAGRGTYRICGLDGEYIITEYDRVSTESVHTDYEQRQHYEETREA